MKTEIFSFNELNVDGNGDYVQIVIKYTGENPVACLWDEAKIKK